MTVDRDAPAAERRVREELAALVRTPPGAVSKRSVRDAAPTIARMADDYASVGMGGVGVDTVRAFLAAGAARSEPATRREATRDLLGLNDDTYGRKLSYRRTRAGARYGRTESTFRQSEKYEAAALEELCHRLIQISHSGSLPGREPTQSEGYVRRNEYISELRAILKTGPGFVSIAGEPGVGKTWLAQHFLREWASGPVMRVRLRGEDVAASDLAFILEGLSIDTRGKDLPGLMRLFKSQLPEISQGSLIIDDTPSVAQLREFLDLDTPVAIPVVVISRVRLDLPTVGGHIQVGPFARSEALEYCTLLGITSSKTELEAFCAVLGRRPLALRQVAGFMAKSGRVSVQNVIALFPDAGATTMDAAARATQASRNLNVIYETMLSDLFPEGPAATLLAVILWLSEQGTLQSWILQELIDVVARAEGYLEVEAAYILLKDVGFLLSTISNRGEVQYEFSTLTYEILTELRPEWARIACEVLVDAIRAEIGHIVHDSERMVLTWPARDHPRASHLNQLAYECLVSVGIWNWGKFRTWGWAVILNRSTWVHGMPGIGNEPSRAYRLIRFLPTGVIAHHEGQRSTIEGKELALLLEFIYIYHAGVAKLYESPPGEYSYAYNGTLSEE